MVIKTEATSRRIINEDYLKPAANEYIKNLFLNEVVCGGGGGGWGFELVFFFQSPISHLIMYVKMRKRKKVERKKKGNLQSSITKLKTFFFSNLKMATSRTRPNRMWEEFSRRVV